MYMIRLTLTTILAGFLLQPGGGGGGPTPLRPMAKRFLAMGLSGPTFFIVSLAWKCDETNFKLLFRRKKISLKKK